MAVDGSRRSIGDYFTLKRGTTYKSRLLGQPGPILLGLATIERNGGFRSDNLKTYGGDSPDELIVSPGDLYVSLKDVTQSADLLGAVARLPSDQLCGRLTQDTVRLVPIGDDVPLDYLYWLLRTPQYRRWCRAHATGTTNLGLPRDDFLAFPAAEPGSFQRQIAQTLDFLEDKIELNRRMSETLEAIARALFRSWFVDGDPVRVGTLSELASLNPESWSTETRPNLIEYVDLASTKWGRIEAVALHDRDGAPSRAQRVLRPRDTIVGTVRPGNGSFAYILREGLTGSTGFAVLRPKKPEFAEYVYLAATDPERIEELAHVADGAAYPAVRPDVVAAMPVAIPGGDVVRSFSSLVGPLLGRIAVNELESKTLATLRDTLLPKLISGELRVGDAEALTETGV